MEDLRYEIVKSLADQIRYVTSIFVPVVHQPINRTESAPKISLTNHQGLIYVVAQPWGLHVFKVDYADNDAIFEYEDPDFPEKIIARCLYLQDIEHHLKNKKIREERERQRKPVPHPGD